jgi:hypothetical protein
VIDAAKALRRAIKDVFGEHALVHRCQRQHRDRRRSSTTIRQPPPSGRTASAGGASASAGHTPSMPAPLIEFPADDPERARRF